MADTHDKMEWLRDDLQYLRKGQDKTNDKIDNLNKKLDIHEKECPAIIAMQVKKSIPPRNSMKPASLIYWGTKLGPIILTTALALVALGAYFGGGAKAEQVEQRLEKLQKVIEKSQQ